MKITIEKIGINGEGIGFENRQPIFIANALPKEVVEVEILETFPKYKTATVSEYIKRSPSRIVPACKMSTICGACTMMHIEYEKQLEYKQDILRQTLVKYAQLDSKKIKKIVENDSPLHYRNSVKIPFSMDGKHLVLGMYRANSNHFVSIKACLVHEQALDQKKLEILKILNKHHLKAFSNKHKDGLRYLILRGFKDKFQCCLVSGALTISSECISDLMAIEGLESLWQSVNTSKKSVDVFGKKMIPLAGKKKLSFKFKGLRLRLSPKSFFQLNTRQAEKLYDVVDQHIHQNTKLVVEAYSGIGVMSLMASKKAEKVVGIEYIQDAVSNANNNAKLNNIENVEFLCGDAGEELVKLSQKKTIDVLIVDPPRSGLDDKMLSCIMRSRINKVIYISCNPATLGKNLKILNKKYKVEEVVPVDMFSQTAHIESVTILVKK